MQVSFWYMVVVSNLILTAGCSSNVNTGGAGGSTTSGGSSTVSLSSTGTGASVVGTRQNGDCSRASAFADQCAAEGGVLGDGCQDAGCSGRGYRAMCYPKPPAPGASEISCEGLFNCAVGQVCTTVNPGADGCVEHRCEAPLAASAGSTTTASSSTGPAACMGLGEQCWQPGQFCCGSVPCDTDDCGGIRAPVGAACTKEGDCLTRLCENGACQPCLPSGAACTEHASCCSFTCTAGSCK